MITEHGIYIVMAWMAFFVVAGSGVGLVDSIEKEDKPSVWLFALVMLFTGIFMLNCVFKALGVF